LLCHLTRKLLLKEGFETPRQEYKIETRMVIAVCSPFLRASGSLVGKLERVSDVWLTVHRNSVWIRKTN
jgi:hypothetical protein